MNAAERNRRAALESALARHTEDVERADLRALERLEQFGYRFRTVAEARGHLAELRDIARKKAEIVAQEAALMKGNR